MASNIGSSYSSPDQALKAAEDFIKLDKNQNAFEILYNFMAVRKNRQWSQSLEKIMTLLVDLSLKLNKYSQLRDPLNNYKYATQHTNIGALETVLNYFSKSSEEIFDDASKKIENQAKIFEVEDLENEDFEELLVNSVDPQARSERNKMKQAWRVLWESYKIILEVSSKNKKLEELYVTVANKAFETCKLHRRRIEFKRMCDQIRNNLKQIKNAMDNNPDFQKIPFVIDLGNIETNDKQLEIRFSQLQYCYHFELWQESLKTLEDLNFIMQKRTVATK